jgi:RNA polymerase sigma-70 factor (ECF subfamily)
MWVQGARNIGHFMLEPGPSACRGSKLVPTFANGCPAFAQYKPDPAGGRSPWALVIVEISAGRVIGVHSFLQPERIFESFGFPLHLPA